MLGILKAGAVYMPIDIDLPKERIDTLLKMSGCKLIISDNNYYTLQEETSLSVPCTNIKSVWKEIEQLKKPLIDETFSEYDPAYIMFTSGSTGIPKGVIVTNTNIVNLVLENDYLQVSPKDNFMLISNFTFDGSTVEIFGALLNGATLHILTLDTIFKAEEFIHIIKESKINTTLLATSFFNKLIDYNPSFVKYFDTILIGGEPISINHVRKALPYLKKDGVLINAYGPTECTTLSLFHRILNITHDQKSIPIGQPITGAKAYVLDSDMNLLPFGVKGNLYISGKGVSLGYCNELELTAEKFISAPWDANETLYNTGDSVYRITDGTIYYIGRTDFQVKFRGYRIELGEVESHICRFDKVKAAVVHVEENDNNKYLSAYIETEDNQLNKEDLSSFLKRSLPPYMIPSKFCFVDFFPLTHNQKIDRKMLVASQKAKSLNLINLPTTSTQIRIASMWKRLLKRENIGIHDNFFELGGHSLMVTQMVSSINNEFKVELKLSSLFKDATIASISTLIDGLQKDLTDFHKTQDKIGGNLVRINRTDFIKK